MSSGEFKAGDILTLDKNTPYQRLAMIVERCPSACITSDGFVHCTKKATTFVNLNDHVGIASFGFYCESESCVKIFDLDKYVAQQKARKEEANMAKVVKSSVESQEVKEPEVMEPVKITAARKFGEFFVAQGDVITLSVRVRDHKENKDNLVIYRGRVVCFDSACMRIDCSQRFDSSLHNIYYVDIINVSVI